MIQRIAKTPIFSYLSCMIMLTLLFPIHLIAQSDNQGSRDNRFIPRLQNYYIAFDDRKEYDEFRFWDGAKLVNVAGEVHIIRYTTLNNKKPLKETKILSTYRQIAEDRNGGSLFEGIYPQLDTEILSNMPAGTFKYNLGTREIWFQVLVLNEGKDYELAVVDGKEKKDNPKADQMLTLLNEEGKVNLYINFDVGKSEIRSESELTIREIAKALTEDRALELTIEGHTDNQGTAASNKSLSQRRAAAVREYLIKQGIEPERLSVLGFGSDFPIADNSTEEGRALNRRVALVKKAELSGQE